MTRTIKTAAVIKALPVGAVLGFNMDGRPRAMVQVAPGEWESTSGAWWTSDRLASRPPAALTVLHDPSAPSVSAENAVEALGEWGVDESDVAALREAAVEAVAWKLIDRTSDLADRAPSDETVRTANADARAALSLLTAAPSATRDEVARSIPVDALAAFITGHGGDFETGQWRVELAFPLSEPVSVDSWRQDLIDAITPKEDR